MLAAIAGEAYGKYTGRFDEPPAPTLLDYEDVARTSEVFVYADGDELLGMVTIERSPSEEFLILRNLAVRTAAQGAGIGKSLTDYVESEARESDAAGVRLWTRSEMRENIRFYTRLGYRETHTDTDGRSSRIHLAKSTSRSSIDARPSRSLQQSRSQKEQSMSERIEPIVTRVSGTFVGEVKEPPITEQMVTDPHSRRAIYEAFLDHKVLAFRGQDISPRTFAEFGTIFGEPEQHHVIKLRHPDEPTLSYISNQDELGRSKEMRYSGDGWHSDYSYKLVPGKATMLHGIQIPEDGGDTLFADAEAAFEELPEQRKEFLRTLRIRHQYRWSPDRNDPWARWIYIGEQERAQTPEISHPLVRRHPDTGRETLFLQPRVIGSVIAVEGMPEDESTALIEALMAHITSDRFVYRHRWNQSDVVVWDNRCVLHSATTKELDERHVRRLLRLTTHGSPVTPSRPEVGYSTLAAVSAP